MGNQKKTKLSSTVTRVKQTEKNLRKSGEKYRNLTESLNELIYRADPNTLLATYVNNAIEEIYGYTAGEWLKDPSLWENTLHPSDKERVFKEVKEAQRRVKDHAIEYRIIRKDKEERWVEDHISWEKDHKGSVLSLNGVLYDITERKKAEEKILYQAFLLENVSDAVISVNTNGEVISWNKQAEKMFGWTEKEAIGKFVGAVTTPPEKIDNVKKIIGTVLKEGIWKGELIGMRKDETNFQTFRSIALLKDKNNNSIGFLGLVKDITEQKKVEERIRILKEKYENLYNNAPIMYMSLNMKGIVIECNNEVSNKLGYSKSELIGTHMTKFTTKESAVQFKRDFPELLKTGRLLSAERQLVAKSGKIVDVILNVTMEYDKNHKAISTKATFEDISDRKKTERKIKLFSKVLEKKVKERTKELLMLNKELEHANKVRAEFTVDASHELRTPLAIIQSNLDLALRKKSSKQVSPRETLSIINTEIKGITKIISDLSLLSRVDVEKQKIERGAVRLDTIIKKAVKKTSILGKDKGISIELEHLDKVTILGDGDELERLIMNLLGNSILYGKPKGAIGVKLTLRNSQAKIVVVDNGIGIPKKDIPFIFDRFYRVNKDRSRESGGTGLGLAICKWIVDVHGGEIRVTSTLGKGSKFVVQLPLL